MKILVKVLALVCLTGIGNFARADESNKVVWPQGKSAVAWKTKKRLFLVKNVEPVGFNTAISFSVKNVDQSKVILISIPIDQFDSGEPARDKEVIKILKGDIQPVLLFTSDPMSEALEKSLNQAQFVGELKGEFKIGGKPFKVSFNTVTVNDSRGAVLEGELHTTFSQFEISPPSVAGGLVAKVKDDLTLMFHIYMSDIK